jgi:Holliday junction resolvase
MDRAHHWLPLLGLAIVCLVLGGLLAQKLARLRERRRGRAYNVRGQRGERAAERLLEAHGYTLIARQIETHYPVAVDGDTVEVMLHADFLVARGRERLVAEVKTGRNAPRFQHAETRRQLLEYQLAFGVDSVLLVDVEAALLREVRFPLPEPTRRGGSAGWLTACLMAGFFIYWLAKP